MCFGLASASVFSDGPSSLSDMPVHCSKPSGAFSSALTISKRNREQAHQGK